MKFPVAEFVLIFCVMNVCKGGNSFMLTKIFTTPHQFLSYNILSCD